MAGNRFGKFRHLAGAVGAIALLSMTGLMLAAPAMADSNQPGTGVKHHYADWHHTNLSLLPLI